MKPVYQLKKLILSFLVMIPIMVKGNVQKSTINYFLGGPLPEVVQQLELNDGSRSILYTRFPDNREGSLGIDFGSTDEVIVQDNGHAFRHFTFPGGAISNSVVPAASVPLRKISIKNGFFGSSRTNEDALLVGPHSDMNHKIVVPETGKSFKLADGHFLVAFTTYNLNQLDEFITHVICLDTKSKEKSKLAFSFKTSVFPSLVGLFAFDFNVQNPNNTKVFLTFNVNTPEGKTITVNLSYKKDGEFLGGSGIPYFIKKFQRIPGGEIKGLGLGPVPGDPAQKQLVFAHIGRENNGAFTSFTTGIRAGGVGNFIGTGNKLLGDFRNDVGEPQLIKARHDGNIFKVSKVIDLPGSSSSLGTLGVDSFFTVNEDRVRASNGFAGLAPIKKDSSFRELQTAISNGSPLYRADNSLPGANSFVQVEANGGGVDRLNFISLKNETARERFFRTHRTLGDNDPIEVFKPAGFIGKVSKDPVVDRAPSNLGAAHPGSFEITGTGSAGGSFSFNSDTTTIVVTAPNTIEEDDPVRADISSETLTIGVTAINDAPDAPSGSFTFTGSDESGRSFSFSGSGGIVSITSATAPTNAEERALGNLSLVGDNGAGATISIVGNIEFNGTTNLTMSQGSVSDEPILFSANSNSTFSLTGSDGAGGTISLTGNEGTLTLGIGSVDSNPGLTLSGGSAAGDSAPPPALGGDDDGLLSSGSDSPTLVVTHVPPADDDPGAAENESTLLGDTSTITISTSDVSDPPDDSSADTVTLTPTGVPLNDPPDAPTPPQTITKCRGDIFKVKDGFAYDLEIIIAYDNSLIFSVVDPINGRFGSVQVLANNNRLQVLNSNNDPNGSMVDVSVVNSFDPETGVTTPFGELTNVSGNHSADHSNECFVFSLL